MDKSVYQARWLLLAVFLLCCCLVIADTLLG
jgi:hypothetical protein